MALPTSGQTETANFNNTTTHSKSRITTLLLDCDNTLALTEEHAFAATAQTINTLLADFKVPNRDHSRNSLTGRIATNGTRGNSLTGSTLLTASALQALEAETSSSGAQVSSAQAADHSNHNGHHRNDDESSTSTTSSSSSYERYQSYSSASLLADYIGLPFRQILASILKRHSLTLTPAQAKHYSLLEETNVNTTITNSSPALPSVLSTLHTLRSTNRFSQIAVVSSSPTARIQTALRKASLFPESAFFPATALFSACDSLPVPTHKPSPAIYIHTLSSLEVSASECLAVEDSVSGCLAAVRAGIRCLGFVGAYHDPSKRAIMRDVLIRNGAGAVMTSWEWNEWDRCLNEMEDAAIPTPISTTVSAPNSSTVPVITSSAPGSGSVSGSGSGST